MSFLTASPIHLSRKDIKSTASTTHGCLVVYPEGKKAKQRVAVGDRTGVVSVFSVGKRLDEVPAFSTAEADAAVAGKGAGDAALTRPPVSCAVLYLDQLFCLRGSVLDAYSRKGKHFFSVDTNATEKIHSLSVHTPFFFISGEFMVTAFKEAKELGFFMSPDRVHEMVAFPVQSALSKGEYALSDFVCCLGCNDRALRLVQESKLVDEVACEAAVTALCFDSNTRQLFYGTQVGSIGVFAVHGDHELKRILSYLPQESSAAAAARGGRGGQVEASPAVTAATTCLCVYDVNCDGAPEVIVGYEDGTVQVFAVVARKVAGAAPQSSLQLIWCGSVGERVVSVAAGAVTQGPQQPDVLVHVFSGKVIAFTLDLDDTGNAGDGGDADAEAAAQRRQEQRDAVTGKKADTEREIASLQEAIATRTRELAAVTGAAEKKAPLVAVASTFTANVTLRSLEQSALLSLVIDADVPLQCALVRSTAADIVFTSTESTLVTLQRRPGQQGGRDAALSRGDSATRIGSAGSFRSVPSAGGGGASKQTRTMALLTPLQPEDGGQGGGSGGGGGRRLEAHLWADEGFADTLSVTLYAVPAPRTAQVKSVLLCALPLYRRVPDTAAFFDSPVERRLALSAVTVKGSFSASHASDWLSRLLPDMADAAAAQQLLQQMSPAAPSTAGAPAERRALHFASTFLGTVLTVEYGEGELVFTSDSLTALSIVKRLIARQASLDGVAFRTQERILFYSAERRLGILRPSMQRCAAAARDAQLLEGLRELQGSESDLSYLSDDHRNVLQNAESVQAEAARQQQHEDYLKRSVVALYDCLAAFRGHAPALTAPLQTALEGACCGTGYSAEALTKLFFPAGEADAERDGVLAAIAAEAAQQQQQQQQQQPAEEEVSDGPDSAALSSPSDGDEQVEEES